jgi:hypothetical protein
MSNTSLFYICIEQRVEVQGINSIIANLRSCFSLSIAAIALGIVAGMALTRTMASLLFGVKPADVATFATVAVLLLCVAIAATLHPGAPRDAERPACGAAPRVTSRTFL